MLERPTLNDLYEAAVVPGEGVLLLSDGEDRVLCGPLYEHLAPWLTGEFSSTEIAARLAAWHAPAEVHYALLELAERGYLGEPHGPKRAPRVGRRPMVGEGSPRTQHGASQSTRATRVVGRVDAAAWAKPLERAGFIVRKVGHIALVLTDDYLRPDIEEINRRALRAHQAWLLAKPGGAVPWIGPLFVPGETCCWRCLEQRLRGNQPVRSYWWSDARRSTATRAGGRHPRVWSPAATHFFRTALVRGVAGGSHASLANTVLTYQSGESKWQRHTVARRPQCPACGDASLYAQQVLRPLRVEPCLKQFTADGGHRCIAPRETVRALAGLIDPLTGVVHDVRKLAARARPLHAYVADHAGALNWPSLTVLQHSLPTRSGGKGQSDVQARASALSEAIERYCGNWQGDEPRVAASLSDLGARAIHPKRCLLYSATQYRRREQWNRDRSLEHRVPVPFDPGEPTDWTPVWSLTEQRHKYLPSMYLYYGYPADPSRAFCWADSNGCAAGNTREEAILQGFLELVERDSVALWWYNRVQRPALDLTGLSGAYCDTLRAYYASLARELWILDITSDLRIPCFAAVSRRIGQGPEQILLGFGAHFDARLAAMRALTEMNQMLAVVRTAEAHGRGLGQTLDAWLAEAGIATHLYLHPGLREPTRLTAFPRIVHRDLRDDMHWCQRVAEQRGMEVLVLDQTRPDINAAVVRVIVPGLRHFRARFAPGRLYDVPVALGWLAKPRTEAELNPVAVFA